MHNIQTFDNIFLEKYSNNLSKLSIDDLLSKKIQKTTQEFIEKFTKDKIIIFIGLGTCGLASGGLEVLKALESIILESNLKDRVFIKKVGCLGICQKEVIVEVKKTDKPRVAFANVTPEVVQRVIKNYIEKDQLDLQFVLGISEGFPDQEQIRVPDSWQSVNLLKDIQFFRKQMRLVLNNCGTIDPNSIVEYLSRGGYCALAKALQMQQKQVIDEVMKSGLRGRGGGGFPTGKKWLFCYNVAADQKYVVMNADEGDPGAFMDRSLLEGDPHKVIEGMIIAGYAIGATKGYIYVRAEYPLAVKTLENAISQCKTFGILGENILNSGFSFDLKIKMGAGAFVCGEETSLIASIEGKRGMPRPRPPFPAVSGLFGKPTIINNVETFANVPEIIWNGAEKFASIGTPSSKGTKVFALTGKVNTTGLIEVPMGITLREIIFDIGGGIVNNNKFKAAQIGGPSGGCIPAELLDTKIDYDSLISAGAMMGSGGLVVMDDKTCMVDVAKYFIEFTRSESCGKCIPCREGIARLKEIMEQIVQDPESETGNIPLERFKAIIDLRQLCEVIKDTSACGLGQTAPNPILSTLRYFKDEYEKHVFDRKCPASVCKPLLKFKVIPEKCKGCSLCKKKCPANAIVGEIKHPHYIVTEKCVKCGVCINSCPFSAIEST